MGVFSRLPRTSGLANFPDVTPPIHLLALTGSLRAGSSNTALLDAARLVAPDNVDVTIYDGLGDLPHFNPDLDRPDHQETLPRSVAALRRQVGDADALLISTPEYAHGIPGAFKNLLDWLVGSLEFPGKPVAILCASPGSGHAEAQLIEVLSTMSAHVITPASVTLPLRGRRLDGHAIAAEPGLANVLRDAVIHLAHVARDATP